MEEGSLSALLVAFMEVLLLATPAATSIASSEFLQHCWRSLSSLMLLILACTLGSTGKL